MGAEWLALLKSIGTIVASTMVLLEERERKSLYREHHDCLQELEDAKNAADYYNSDVDNSRIRLRIFLDAYGALLGSKNLGTVPGKAPTA